MKLYTKTGDGGDTSLFGGDRRSKADSRVAAYGDVDELQAQLGVVLSLLTEGGLNEVLTAVQSDCFTLSCELARTSTKPSRKDPVLADQRVAWLEQHIDTFDAEVPPLKNFILQGGAPAAAQLFLARAVCRRAERSVVGLSKEEPVRALIIQYLNRLSDLLFVMGRLVNYREGKTEVEWKAS